MVKKILIFLFALGYILSAYAQADLDTLAGRITERLRHHAPETVYLQTSKGIYEAGEDLWFKAYQLDAQTLLFSALSQTLYLEIRGENDTLVWQEKYPIENGITQGHVYIDRELPAGDYFMEAFTPHSFYADSNQLVSVRKIRVVDNIGRYTQTPDTTTLAVTEHFTILPEGGNLVYGIPARLAFKATDGRGNPSEVSGMLYENDQPLQPFFTQHAGMGSIDFTPRKGKAYRIELSGGENHPLPPIHDEGVSLRLSGQTGEHLLFTVRQSAGLTRQPFYLLGQQRGMVCSIARGMLRDSIMVKIPLDDFLGQGIAQFTLFTRDMKPVAERLVYLFPEKKLDINVTTAKEAYFTREKAEVTIKVTDEDGNPVQAHLGVSVFDEAYHDPAGPANILSHYHLSSQLKGKIYNPAYYFDEENKDRREALDLLMLTQGWRRYVWDVGTFIPCGDAVLTDGIPGRQTFKSERKSRDVSSGEQLVQVFGAEGDAQFVWTDSAGYFNVEPEILKDLRGDYIYLKPMLGKEFTPKVETEGFFHLIDSLRKIKARNYPLADNMPQPDRKREDRMPVMSSDSIIILDEFTVIGTKGRVHRDKFMGRLDSMAQRNLNPAWVCECPPGYLNDYLPGYTHHRSGRSGKYERLAPVHGKTYRVIKYEPREDGVWHVADEKTVEYRGPYYSDEELLRMNNIQREKGYYGKREFYQPDEFDLLSSVPDSRNTLLWDPGVVTGENGEATVSFYCSDINNKFMVHVEGAGGNGLLGTGKKEFRVMRDVKVSSE
jgi:MG2 domain.